MNRLLLSFLFSAFQLFSFSQNGNTKGATAVNRSNDGEMQDTGTIYGLVVGVSKYEDPNMPPLHYADSDAVYFDKFLRSGVLGTTDSANIKLLINEAATDNNIKRERQWILRRIKPGDRVYIYLSGHGDAINSEAIYFLSYNTPKVSDKSEYTVVSGVDMLQMQTVIKMFIEKQAKVFLITDFCRTSELVGQSNSSRFLFTNVMDFQVPGLTKMISCGADEFSFEDKKWGNGRGVFSFYLINGLLGLADNTNTPDGKISLYELKTYVEQNVMNDTKSLSTGEPRQTPEFRGDKQVLCRVNEEVKQQLKIHHGNNSEYLAMAMKSAVQRDIADTSLYQNFIACMNAGKLIAPANHNARYYLNELLKITTDPMMRADLTDMFVAVIIDKGQTPINYYSLGWSDSIIYTSGYFTTAANYLDASLPYLSENKDLYQKVKASALFLRARATTIKKSEDGWRYGIRLADSSLAIRKSPYTLHTKAMLLSKIGRRDSAALLNRKVIEEAPHWVFGYVTMGRICRLSGLFDSAIFYHKKAIALNNSCYECYQELAYDFQRSGLKDSAIFYLKKLSETNHNRHAEYNNIAVTFYRMGLDDSAYYYFKKAQSIPPPSSAVHNNLGLIFHHYKHNDDSALYYFKRAIEIDSNSRRAVFNIGMVYYDMNNLDSAQYYFECAHRKNINYSWAYFGMGLVSYNRGKIDSANVLFSKALLMDSANNFFYYRLCKLYSKYTMYDKALTALSKALEKGFDHYKLCMTDVDLEYLRTTEPFKALLWKYFPDKYKEQH